MQAIAPNAHKMDRLIDGWIASRADTHANSLPPPPTSAGSLGGVRTTTRRPAGRLGECRPMAYGWTHMNFARRTFADLIYVTSGFVTGIFWFTVLAALRAGP
jgi:hypothetical protein